MDVQNQNSQNGVCTRWNFQNYDGRKEQIGSRLAGGFRIDIGRPKICGNLEKSC